MGQISLHDLFLVHGSKPNFSGRPRRGMTMRFFPTTSTFERSATSPKVPLLLMRGRDRTAQQLRHRESLGAASEGKLRRWPDPSGKRWREGEALKRQAQTLLLLLSVHHQKHGGRGCN